VKPVKLTFLTGRPELLNLVVEDYLQMLMEVQKAKEQKLQAKPLSTAEERIRDGKRRSRILFSFK